MATVFLGTEIKLNINIEPIGDFTMADYDFDVDVWTNPKKSLHFTKDETIEVDDNNRLVIVDTKSTGAGDLRYKITARIPDEDMGKPRTEVFAAAVGIYIVEA